MAHSRQAGHHLFLNGSQIRQEHPKAHGHYEDQDATESLPQTSQEHSIEGGDVRAEASRIEVNEVKVPAMSANFFDSICSIACRSC